MKNPAYFLLMILCFFISQESISQTGETYKFDKIKASDFNISSPLIDSGTGAVILAAVGSTSFVGNKNGWFDYVFKKRERILILKRNAFDLATLQIELYKGADDEEKISDLVAISYKLVNGQVTELKAGKKDIYEERYDKNHLLKKLAIPGVSEGTIIEYSYTITSPFCFNMPSWKFQHIEYPTLWSEYNTTIPGTLVYMMSRQGYHPFYIDNKSEGFEYYTVKVKTGNEMVQQEEVLRVGANTVKNKWVQKDLAAFGNANFLTTPDNYIDKINFQLYQTQNGEEKADVHDVITNWEKLNTELMKDDDFGKPILERDTWMSDLVGKITVPGSDPVSNAINIYNYVHHNFTCTNAYNKYIKTSLKDVFKKKSGTVGEINLLLIALLKEDGFNADPMLLSTREFGKNSPNYPMLEKLNYVICRVAIAGKVYFLDATEPYISFGHLPLKCFNGHARVIGDVSEAYNFRADSIKELKLTSVKLSLDKQGTLTGSCSMVPGYYESMKIRKEVNATSLEQYGKKYEHGYTDEILVRDFNIDSLKLENEPVDIRYTLSFNNFKHEDIIYFNPMLADQQKTNPFTEESRVFPVEMPYPLNETYLLDMEIPEGFKVDEMPKSIMLKLNENQGKFEYLIKNEDRHIQLRCQVKLEKANFSPDYYKMLRDFFALIVKKESEQIVFKKVKS